MSSWTSRPASGAGIAAPGRAGCTIYDRRPDICSGFTCSWLQGDLHEHWRPEASHMVVHGRDTDEGRIVAIYVDPQFPDAWKQEPYLSDIKDFAVGGADGALGFRFDVCVVIGGRVGQVNCRHSGPYPLADTGAIAP